MIEQQWNFVGIEVVVSVIQGNVMFIYFFFDEGKQFLIKFVVVWGGSGLEVYQGVQ